MKESSTEIIIFHKGIVQKTEKNSVTVVISSESACAGCNAEGSCSLSGGREKIVDIQGHFNVKEGDPVIVQMKQSAGFNALFLGYILPLVIILAFIIILSALQFSELTAGLAAFSSLLPYYLILYLLRNKINDKFIFSLKE